MYRLDSLFRPSTAESPAYRRVYAEWAPAPALAPYVSCYWGIPDGAAAEPDAVETVWVVPDACMDILFMRDRVTGQGFTRFSGIGTAPFSSRVGKSRVELFFAVRFYFWAARLFASAPIAEAGGLEAVFPGWDAALTEPMARAGSVAERIAIMEAFLQTKLALDRGNHNVLNAVYHTLRTRGVSPIKEICGAACVSQRQLERLFHAHVGLTIKQTAGVVRYQNIWRDVLLDSHFDVHDTVIRYGFTDQAHLLNNFRKYHGLTPAQAKALTLG